ncbi:hypothetical protein Emag_003472 [Eimeria magna]
MPRRHCVRSAGTGEGSTATRRSGESWRQASGVPREGPRSELERAGERERRRRAGSAAVVDRAGQARVRGGSPAASQVPEVVEAERLRLGRGGVARATMRRGRRAHVEARTMRRVATIVRVKPVHQVTWCVRQLGPAARTSGEATATPVPSSPQLAARHANLRAPVLAHPRR